MKKTILAIVAAALSAGAADLRFSAVPVWAEGRTTERNLTLGFRVAFDGAKVRCTKPGRVYFHFDEVLVNDDVDVSRTDCPSRERAGRLGDSFFTSRTERLNRASGGWSVCRRLI